MLNNKEKIKLISNLAGGSKMLGFMLGISDSAIYEYMNQGITPMFILLLESSKYFFNFNRDFFHVEIEEREKSKIPFIKARLKQKENEKQTAVIEKTPIFFLLNEKK